MASTSSNDLHIGVLCIDAAHILIDAFGDKVKSYIPASYVQYLEAAGAKVVPIWINKEQSYYNDIMCKINGILLPGGAVLFEKHEKYKNDCIESAKLIFEIARKQMDLPIFCICLGFQLMFLHSITGDETNTRQNCAKVNGSMNIIFEKDFRNSKLFTNLSQELESQVQKERCAHHHHQFCVTKEILKTFKIDDQWTVLATQRNIDETEFITIAEHKHFPFFGCQFHPERAGFEDVFKDDSMHTETSIKFAEYLINFFLTECRKNTNHFLSSKEEELCCIQNYKVTDTKDLGGRWKECYIFKENIN